MLPAAVVARGSDVKPLAVCAIFKDEARYLLEWLAYHSVIGFDRFVLYDNGSTDGGSELVRSSRFAGRATVIHWPERPGQLSAYQHFIDCYRRDFEWAAFIDLDEFLHPLAGDSVVPLLAACDGFSAVLVQWRCFGPSGWTDRPDGLVIENYNLRLDDEKPVNRTVKSIVRCADLEGISATPHQFDVRGPVCDTLGRQTFNTPTQPVACQGMAVINHYITKSKQDWLEKLRRGSPDRDDAMPTYKPDVFDKLAQECTVEDNAIKRFVPRVRALLTGNPDAASNPNQPGSPDRSSNSDNSDGMRVANRLIRLEPGLFSLSLESRSLEVGPHAASAGLPGVRVALPPNPEARGNAVSISAFRADGWLTRGDEPTLIRVAGKASEVLITLYWSANDGAAAAPALRLTRVD